MNLILDSLISRGSISIAGGLGSSLKNWFRILSYINKAAILGSTMDSKLLFVAIWTTFSKLLDCYLLLFIPCLIVALGWGAKNSSVDVLTDRAFERDCLFKLLFINEDGAGDGEFLNF